MESRRVVSIERLDDVRTEVDRLLAGHSTCGTWTLGQILHHLATALLLSLETDQGATGLEPDPEAGRVFKVRRRLFFRGGRFPDGAEPPLAALIPPKDADARVEAGRLREALDRFQAHRGPFPDHPLLGTMSRDEWETFHRFHCERHLSFARVESDGGVGR